jgi:hypothetical protein
MKTHYLPRTADQRRTWLNTFSSKISGYATKYGLTTAEVNSILAMALFYSYWVDVADQAKTFKEKITKFMGTLSFAPTGAPLGEVPAFAPATAPATTPAGIFTYIGGIVQRIKGHADYAENDGQDLGIIGDEQEFNEDTFKPELKAFVQLDGVKITFTKKAADAMNIYGNPIGSENPEEWELLGTDFHSPYLDSRPPAKTGTPENRRYMGRAVIDDKEIGVNSDEVKVVFGTTQITGGRPVVN